MRATEQIDALEASAVDRSGTWSLRVPARDGGTRHASPAFEAPPRESYGRVNLIVTVVTTAVGTPFSRDG